MDYSLSRTAGSDYKYLVTHIPQKYFPQRKPTISCNRNKKCIQLVGLCKAATSYIKLLQQMLHVLRDQQKQAATDSHMGQITDILCPGFQQQVLVSCISGEISTELDEICAEVKHSDRTNNLTDEDKTLLQYVQLCARKRQVFTNSVASRPEGNNDIPLPTRMDTCAVPAPLFTVPMHSLKLLSGGVMQNTRPHTATQPAETITAHQLCTSSCTSPTLSYKLSTLPCPSFTVPNQNLILPQTISFSTSTCPIVPQSSSPIMPHSTTCPTMQHYDDMAHKTNFAWPSLAADDSCARSNDEICSSQSQTPTSSPQYSNCDDDNNNATTTYTVSPSQLSFPFTADSFPATPISDSYHTALQGLLMDGCESPKDSFQDLDSKLWNDKIPTNIDDIDIGKLCF